MESLTWIGTILRLGFGDTGRSAAVAAIDVFRGELARAAPSSVCSPPSIPARARPVVSGAEARLTSCSCCS